MHEAEHEQDEPNLRAERLDCLGKILRPARLLEREHHEPDIDQVEADDQKLVDRIRQRRLAAERLDQKHAPVLVECASDPDGQSDADEEIGGVGLDDVHVHLRESSGSSADTFCTAPLPDS